MDTNKYQDLSFREDICLKKLEDCSEDILTFPKSDIYDDRKSIINDTVELLDNNNIKHLSTWMLESNLYIQSEKDILKKETNKLSRGRVVMVNPGANKIGREQRYMHPYIVLGEYQETFIGVPMTNMAFNPSTKQYYLRNVFEVELIDPKYKKPYTEYRCKKRTVADIRNIAGLDKRRIVKTTLFLEKKFAPKTYLDAISKKIIETIAII